MKIIVSALVFIALPLFGQQVPPTPPKPTPPAAKSALSTPNLPPPHGPTPQFTQLEQVIANDISEKQQKLQQEINDFMVEVREHHPGYEFFNGNLVPTPPTPPKTEDKK